MGVCLRGKMVDAGILPRPATALLESPAVRAPDVAPVTAEPETAIAEPELEVTPSATEQDELVAATFGLLRAEPDGSVVIAGSGTPGSEVEVYSNGDLLGKTKVETTGDWVLVPDAPIPPGGTELTLAEAGKEGRAAESFVVVINNDKTSEPLVVASTPGAASEVLQGLTRPEIGSSTDVAAVGQPAPVEAPATTEPTPATEAVADAATAAPGTEEPTTPAAASAPVPEAPAVEEPATAEAPIADVPAAGTDQPEVSATADPVAPAQPEPAVALAAVPPTIDAIELEGDKSFFAGAGPEGAVMRLYVDGKYIADATVADGRWLVEAGNVLTQPSQRIRIDMLTPGTADVAARAEVDFEVQLPAETPTAVAEAAPPVAEPVAPAETPAAPAVTEQPAPVAAVAPPAAPAPAPTSETAAADESPAPSAVVTNEPTPLPPADQPSEPVTTPAPEPAKTVAETAPVPAAQPEPVAQTPAPEVVVEPEVQTAETAPVEAAPAEANEVPTMVAVAVGDPEMERFASGKAIIRRGDNLWTIARRVYGAGIKYTAIYEANNGQIRNPNRIYPGQVFDLPESAN